MRATRARRAKYVAAILPSTGLATCSFPIVTRAESWHKAFAGDHDAEFLLNGVTFGFRYASLDPGPNGVLFYIVPNYAPDVHAPKVTAWVAAETATGRYQAFAKVCGPRCCGQGQLEHDQSTDFAPPLQAYWH